MRIVAGAAHQGDRVVVDGVRHGRHVGSIIVSQRGVTHFDPHPVRALVQRNVGSHGHHDVGAVDSAGCGLLPIGKHRGDQALRAAAGHDSAGTRAAV